MVTVTKSRAWWNAKAGKVHEQVLPYVRTVENTQAYTYQKFFRLEATYDTDPRTNRGAMTEGLRAQGVGSGATRALMTENLIATNLDTVAANVADADISLRIETDGADWSHARTAKRLEMYLNGLMKLFGVVEKCQTAFKLGAALKGTGLIKVWVDQFDQIQVTPVRVDNIIVDQIECPNGQSKQLHYRDYFDREDLQAQFPEYAEQIERAQTSSGWARWAGYRPLEAHEVVVIESWRLPIGPKGHESYRPGRHTLCIDGCDLLDEAYDDAFFPFAKMVWNQPSYGYYGISMAERILPHQALMTRRQYQINASLNKKADPVTYVHQGDQHLAVKTINQLGTIAVYKVAKPETVDHQAVGQETYNSVKEIRASAQNETGVNEMMQAGAVSSGIQSGAGVREERQTHSQRFSRQEKQYEQFIVDTMWLVLHACKSLGGTKAPDILKVSKYGNKRIKWSEVDMDDLRIEMTVASDISNTPAGRQQRVTELAQAGIITLDESRSLIDHPDIDRVLSMYNAAMEAIEFQIERVLDGESVMPGPYDNLHMGLTMFMRQYEIVMTYGEEDEAVEKVLEGLSAWIDTAANTLNPPPPPQPPGMPMGAPGMPPPGGPMPPPGPGGPPGAAGPMLQSQAAAAAPSFAPGAFSPMSA